MRSGGPPAVGTLQRAYTLPARFEENTTLRLSLAQVKPAIPRSSMVMRRGSPPIVATTCKSPTPGFLLRPNAIHFPSKETFGETSPSHPSGGDVTGILVPSLTE